MPKVDRIYIRISEEEKAKWKEEATKQGLDLASFVRMSVTHEMKRRKK